MKLNLLRMPDHVSALYEEGWHKLGLQDTYFTNGAVQMNVLHQEASVKLSLQNTEKRIEKILIRWQESVGAGKVLLGDHWERAYGDLQWHGIIPEKEMPWYFFVSDKKGVDGYGVKTQPSALCSWFYDGSYVSLLLDVRCGGKGVDLRNRTLDMAEIVTRTGKTGEDIHEAMHDFCQMMCTEKVLPIEPIYGGNNWYYAYGKFDEQDIMADTRLMDELAPKTGSRPYMVLDDGWQVGKGSERTCDKVAWTPHPEKFPDMPRLVRDMKALDVKPGIWYRPLLTNYVTDSSLFLETPHEIGKTVPGPILDPSKPEVLALVKEQMRTFKKWGFELVKHDFTTFDCLGLWGQKFNFTITPSTWHFSDETKTTAEVYKNLYAAIQEGAEGMLIIGCNTFSHLSAGYFELQRTGDDTSGLQWERTRRMGINTLAFRMAQHDAFYAVDADCVGVTEKVDWDLNKQWLDVLAKSGTPLFVSADYKVLTEEQKEALKEAFARAAHPRRVSVPLDFMDSTMPTRWLSEDGVDTYCFTELDRIEQCSGYLG